MLDSLLLPLEGVETSLLSLIKVSLVALVFSFGDVITRNVNSSVGETKLVCDPLDLFLLHFLCNSGTKVLWTVFGLFFQLLLLYFCQLFREPTTVNLNKKLTLSQLL